KECSRGFALFRSQTLEDIPRTYSWFAEMRTQHPVFYEERIRLWQVFRYEDVLAVMSDYNHFSSQAFGGTDSFLRYTLVETSCAAGAPLRRKTSLQRKRHAPQAHHCAGKRIFRGYWWRSRFSRLQFSEFTLRM